MSARNAPDGAFRIRCIMLILEELLKLGDELLRYAWH